MKRSIVLWMLMCGACLYEAEAVLETFFIEELCEYKANSIIDLSRVPTGILRPLMPSTSPIDCTVRLQPKFGYSVVLSIYNYNLDEATELTIEDSDRYKIALVGVGKFQDEKKSIISDGRIFIHYRSNLHKKVFDSSLSNETVQSTKTSVFQFTFTQVGKGPCRDKDFKCKNGNCLPKEYVCSGHNRCGDNSDTRNCVVKDSENRNSKKNDSPTYGLSNASTIWITLIIVGGVILTILIIAYLVVLIKYSKKKSNASSASGNKTNCGVNNAPLHSVSSTVPQNPPPPSYVTPVQCAPISSEEAPKASVYDRLRRSLRRPNTTRVNESVQEQRTENYQVPSMYPSLDPEPTAPEMYGVDNPDFKSEE